MWEAKPAQEAGQVSCLFLPPADPDYLESQVPGLGLYPSFFPYVFANVSPLQYLNPCSTACCDWSLKLSCVL